MDGGGEWLGSVAASVVGVVGGGLSAVAALKERLRSGEERLKRLEEDREKCKERHGRDTDCINVRLNELTQKGHEIETKIYSELSSLRVELRGLSVALGYPPGTGTTWIDKAPPAGAVKGAAPWVN